MQTAFERWAPTRTSSPGGLVIRPTPLHGDADLDPAHDHRMAMCFSLLGLRLPDIRVANPGCVTKSYPALFEMLARFNQK